MSTSEEPPTDETRTDSPVPKRQKTECSEEAAIARNNEQLFKQIVPSKFWVKNFLSTPHKFDCVTKSKKAQATKYVVSGDGNFVVPGRVVGTRHALYADDETKCITKKDQFGAQNNLMLHLNVPYSGESVPGVDDMAKFMREAREAILEAPYVATLGVIVPEIRKIAADCKEKAKKSEKDEVLGRIRGIDAHMMREMVNSIKDIDDDREAAKKILESRYFIKSCGMSHHTADGDCPDDKALILRANRKLYDENLCPKKEDEGKWRSQIFNIMLPSRKPVPQAKCDKSDVWPGFHENAIERNDIVLARVSMKVTACNGWSIGFEPNECAICCKSQPVGHASSLFTMAENTPVYA